MTNPVLTPVLRKRIYIAGPISKGDLLHNINQGTEAFVALAKAGFAPMCPQWSAYSKPAYRNVDGDVYCQASISGNDRMAHTDWMGVDLPWVEASDMVLRLPGESTGADMETDHASRHGIPVVFSVEEAIARLGSI